MPSEHTESVQVQGEQRPAVGRAGRPTHTHYHVLVRKNGLSSFSDTIVVFWLLLASFSFFFATLCVILFVSWYPVIRLLVADLTTDI